MRSATTAVAVMVLATLAASSAYARPSVYTMTCAQAQAFVRQHGAVVANTGPQTFQRFVTDQRGCSRQEVAWPAYGRTRDNPQCLIGMKCIDAPEAVGDAR
ncbi:hypothetical protein [uncultured Roseibium sp.]|uniref:hypothetical protein n=1 Tax=uncultured Roseibium sp. TaxID=1936171 RepID=UPI003217A5A8